MIYPLIRIFIHVILASVLNLVAQWMFNLKGIEVFSVYFVILAARYYIALYNFTLAYLLQPEAMKKELDNWRTSFIKKD